MSIMTVLKPWGHITLPAEDLWCCKRLALVDCLSLQSTIITIRINTYSNQSNQWLIVLISIRLILLILNCFDDYHRSSIQVGWQACTRWQSRELDRKLAATEMIILIITNIQKLKSLRSLLFCVGKRAELRLLDGGGDENLVEEEDGKGGVDPQERGGVRRRRFLPNLRWRDDMERWHDDSVVSLYQIWSLWMLSNISRRSKVKSSSMPWTLTVQMIGRSDLWRYWWWHWWRNWHWRYQHSCTMGTF